MATVLLAPAARGTTVTLTVDPGTLGPFTPFTLTAAGYAPGTEVFFGQAVIDASGTLLQVNAFGSSVADTSGVAQTSKPGVAPLTTGIDPESIAKIRFEAGGPGLVTVSLIVIMVPQLEAAISQLQGIVDDSLGTPQADKVEDTLAKAQTAVDELAKTPPDNQAALGAIEGAVGDLIAAVNDNALDSAVGIDLMDQLAGIARQLAQDALDAATACDPTNPDLVVAQASMNDGDTLRASGLAGTILDFKDAVNAYKDALTKAEGVLSSC